MALELSSLRYLAGFLPAVYIAGETGADLLWVTSAMARMRLRLRTAEVMESLVSQVERRWGVSRHDMAPETVFVSHETYTPARGGSAGGYTTLCALVFHDVFKAGASYYGVSDLEALAQETHKFEARYLDRLVGPYPARRDLYIDRSPIHHGEDLSCPVIFFQGLEDKVVPPGQAERMVEILRGKKLPVAYVAFDKEQHGFRMAQNIKQALDAELYFYSRIFGFQLADGIESVEIENL